MYINRFNDTSDMKRKCNSTKQKRKKERRGRSVALRLSNVEIRYLTKKSMRERTDEVSIEVGWVALRNWLLERDNSIVKRI